MATAQTPTAVYTWDAAGWLASYPTAQFTGTAITNPDGSTGAQITVTPHSTANPYNYIFVHNAGLTGGHQYTAVVTFSIAAPTFYPSSFYLFARNTAGNQYDILQKWSGLPGPTRKIVLPLDLPALSGTWTLNLGISYGGAINLNSVVVYNGLTSDGVQPYARIAPVLNGTPSQTLPPGVTEATGFTAFTTTAPTTSGGTVTPALTADYAGAPATVATNNAAALKSAIASCGAGATLLITPGTYRIASTTTIAISGKSNLTIDGQGSTFIFENLLTGDNVFNLTGCSKVVMKNLTLDWDWNVKPIASLGTVSNLSGLECDFTFATTLTAAQINLIKTTPWRGVSGMDATHLVRNDNYGYSAPTNSSGVAVYPVITPGSASNILHASFPSLGGNPKFVNGKSYCIRHLYYDMGMFKVTDCDNLVFNTVTINSVPGMGWFFQGKMRNFQIYNCKIARPTTGLVYPLTTAADGIHVGESMGNIIIENCNITGTGDDAINIHDNVYQCNIVPLSANSIRLMNCASWQLRLTAGDPLQFYNADYSHLGTSATPVTLPILSFTPHDSSSPPYEDITFNAASLPAGLTSQSIVRSANYGTKNLRIVGNTIQYTNGRGILFSGDDATFSGNFIYHVYSEPMFLETDIVQMLWAEGHGSSNLVIKSNTIQDCNLQGRYGGSYIYANCGLPYGQTTTTLYDTLSIENNVFYDCPGPAVSLNNAANVIFSGNQMRLGVAPVNTTNYAGTVIVTNSADLALGNNRWLNYIPSSSTYGVIYDPATVTNISTSTNTLTNSY